MPVMSDDILLPQGTTFTKLIPPPNGPTGTPLPITSDWVATGQIRLQLDDPNSVVYAWPATDLACSAAGVTVKLPKQASRLWAFRWGSYQIEVTNPVGEVYRWTQAAIRVIPWVIGDVALNGLVPSASLAPSALLAPRGP